MKLYTRPTLESLGSVRDLTMAMGNKVGSYHDIYSDTVPLVGSVVPAP